MRTDIAVQVHVLVSALLRQEGMQQNGCIG